nr:phage tail protein [uncultured Mediterranean phage uvMED]
MTDKYIAGAGGGGGGKGGGGGGGSANVAADNLDSRQIARVVDLLCEGEIEGFPSGFRFGATSYSRDSAEYNIGALKDIFFDNTQVLREGADPANVQNSDYNFDVITDAAYEFRYGTQDQSVLQNLQVLNQATVQVNTKVIQATPITRTITDTDTNEFRVTVGTPALQIFQNNGDVDGAVIEYDIEVSYAGGSFTSLSPGGTGFKIEGRTNDLYQKKHGFPVTGSFPIAIRVKRLNRDAPPSGDTTENSDFFWYDYTEKANYKTRYPNSALFGLKINAQQFSQIPRRSYRLRGLKVQIPHNGVVQADGHIVYNGTFNGSLGAAVWTSDPVWCLYDLLTSKRYGLGNHVEAADLDIYSFYAASQYCNESVDNLNGGVEPRFSCNVVIQTQQDAYKLISQMCSVFRAMPFWEAGTLAFSQDRPEDYLYIFNQSNVTEAGFSYSGSSRKTRYTCVSVKWFDNDVREYQYELVEDNKGIEKFGYVKTSIDAFACTSQGQARRLGEWLLYTNSEETEVVTFDTDLAAGITVRPGDRIKIGDPVRAGQSVSGRCTSGSTTTSIKLDRSDTVLFGGSAPSSFTINVVLPDGTLGIQGSSTISGSTVTPGAALTAAPTAGAPFSIGWSEIQLSTWRVISVIENSEGTYTVTASAYNSNKYAHIERNQILERRDVSNLNEPPEAPTNLQCSEILYESAGSVLQKLIINWQSSTRATSYEVGVSVNSGNFKREITRSVDLEVLNSKVGTYQIEVVGIGSTGKRSQPALLTFTAVGKTAPPANIASLNISPVDGHTAELYWPQSTDLDVRVGGTVEIRHTPHTDANAVWGRAQDIVPAVNGSSTRKLVPLKEGTYLLRAKDSLGNYAAPAGIPSVVVDLPEPQDLELVQTYTEQPSFGGTFTNMFFSSDENGIALSSTGQIDDITDFDAVTSIDFLGNTAPSGEYQFASTLDLGAKYDVELLSVLQIRAFQPTDTWDDRTELIDTWNDIDADDLSDTDVQLFVRSSNDDPSGSPTYGTWEPFVNNTARGRAFQFKAVATSSNVAQNPLIEQLGVKVRLQRRTEQQRNITSGTGAKAITFPSAFRSVPSIGITAQDFDGGDYFQLSSISRTGFTVTFKNSSDTIISKVFDYQAVGHGKEIS